MSYTIGEMSEKLGVAPSTLRYYDKEGLLPFVERSPGGIRIFKDSDCEFLKIIGCLKNAGMQIKEIRHFIGLVMQGDESIGERLELFRRRRDEAQRQLEQLRETLDILDFKCWYYETALEAGSTQAAEEAADSLVPQRLRAVRAKLREN